MIENKINGEQPESTSTSTTAVDFENVSLDCDNGSPIGKFKSVESLLEAYNNLHSEFTKKCQAYSDLKRRVDNGDNANAPLKENWQQSVEEFLEKHPNAKAFAKQISELISCDKVMQNNANSLEIAYGNVLEKENEKLLRLLKDEDYIMSKISDKMKDRILKEYFKGVTTTSPTLISNGSGNSVVSTYKKPSNMSEAKEMARKIFN